MYTNQLKLKFHAVGQGLFASGELLYAAHKPSFRWVYDCGTASGKALVEALLKLFYLALRNISKKWTMPIRDWKAALTRFTIEFGDRLAVSY